MTNPAHLHLLKPQTLRMWKLITYSGTAYIGYHMVFKADYSSTTVDGEHCFSEIQRWYNRKWDRYLGVDAKAVEEEVARAAREAKTAATAAAAAKATTIAKST